MTSGLPLSPAVAQVSLRARPRMANIYHSEASVSETTERPAGGQLRTKKQKEDWEGPLTEAGGLILSNTYMERSLAT